MGVRDGGREESSGCERRQGELTLTLRGDIESFAILQKKNNAKKVLFWWRANVICLGEESAVGWDGVSKGWIFNVFLELLLRKAQFINNVREKTWEPLSFQCRLSLHPQLLWRHFQYFPLYKNNEKFSFAFSFHLKILFSRCLFTGPVALVLVRESAGERNLTFSFHFINFSMSCKID